MKINNVGPSLVNRGQYNSKQANNSQKNEIVVVNRKLSFQANPPSLPEGTIKRFGLNMECLVTKTPKPTIYEPAPDSLGESLTSFFRKLEIDWRTHVDPNHPRKRFE